MCNLFACLGEGGGHSGGSGHVFGKPFLPFLPPQVRMFRKFCEGRSCNSQFLRLICLPYTESQESQISNVAQRATLAQIGRDRDRERFCDGSARASVVGDRDGFLHRGHLAWSLVLRLSRSVCQLQTSMGVGGLCTPIVFH